MNTRRLSPRGAALLIVLATLILAVTASVTAAKVASTRRLGRELAHRTQLADDLLAAADAPIRAWLSKESSKVVLAPDATEPRVEVLHDTWEVEGTPFRVCVTAWDQCGMVQIDVARSGSPLRLAIASDVRTCIDRMEPAPDVKPGLDLFLCLVAADTPASVFPVAMETEPLAFTTAADSGANPAPAGLAPGDQLRPAIGSSVATHNPGLMNVNTAPIELVEAALRATGRGGVEQIVAARSEGKPASLAGGPEGSGDSRQQLRFVSSSTSWAFRIDIGVGSLQRSWWAVYAGRAGAQWECVQRLAIPE